MDFWKNTERLQCHTVSCLLMLVVLIVADASKVLVNVNPSTANVDDLVKISAEFPSISPKAGGVKGVYRLIVEAGSFDYIYEYQIDKEEERQVYPDFKDYVDEASIKYEAGDPTSTFSLQMKTNHCLNKAVRLLVTYADLQEITGEAVTVVHSVLPKPEMKFYQDGVCKTCLPKHTINHNRTGELVCTVTDSSVKPVITLRNGDEEVASSVNQTERSPCLHSTTLSTNASIEPSGRYVCQVKYDQEVKGVKESKVEEAKLSLSQFEEDEVKPAASNDCEGVWCSNWVLPLIIGGVVLLVVIIGIVLLLVKKNQGDTPPIPNTRPVARPRTRAQRNSYQCPGPEVDDSDMNEGTICVVDEKKGCAFKKFPDNE